MTPRFPKVKKSFSTALTKSGILDFKFHDLRHTFASHLVMLGIDLKTVQELMGHKCIEMTLRYSHLSPAHKKRAIEILGTSMDSYMDSKDKSRKDAFIRLAHKSLRSKELATVSL